MAQRPLAFGVRLRDRDRTLRVRAGRAGRYVLEDARGAGRARREHASLGDALRDLARSWRQRLH
jgi:hypothetical protein